ncbi:Carboxylesterase family-domain-containing protein [Podospora australis]|uniref:Carboxylesterase family-domain-containing protein n=1 Tax=Podospora australis TaxID=1536484 RepID=A0AAN7ACY7_9PEZI|nr:Carboxylesterase family-domain-containing protein [Podospora australis]
MAVLGFNLGIAESLASSSFHVTGDRFDVICPQAIPDWKCDTGCENLYDQEWDLPDDKTHSPLDHLSDKYVQDKRQSEDCLFLDVFVPTDMFNNHTDPECIYQPNGRGSPVIVTLGQNSFTEGSKNHISYPIRNDGNVSGAVSPAILTEHFLEDTACGNGLPIIVAVNYRLGMFGFYTDNQKYGNAGLQDQRLALQWVERHINTFGGDPWRITAAGSGAGGASVMLQITAYGGGTGYQSGFGTPETPGIRVSGNLPFTRAIVMTPHWDFAQNVTATHEAVKAAARAVTGRDNLNLTLEDLVRDLRELESNDLMAINQLAIKNAPVGTSLFGPVVGGVFVPAHPGVLLRDEDFSHNIKILTGTFENDMIGKVPMVLSPDAEPAEFMDNILGGFREETRVSIWNHFYRSQTKLDKIFETPDSVRWKPRYRRPLPDHIEPFASMLEEVTIGCNIRNLAKAFGSDAFVFDGTNQGTSGGMAGLFTTEAAWKVNPLRKRLHRFIGAITTLEMYTDEIWWPPYDGPLGRNVLQLDLSTDDVSTTDEYIFDNDRCDWWESEGYERLANESGTLRWGPWWPTSREDGTRPTYFAT